MPEKTGTFEERDGSELPENMRSLRVEAKIAYASALRATGMSLSKIAKELDIDVRTVKAWSAAGRL